MDNPNKFTGVVGGVGFCHAVPDSPDCKFEIR